MTARTPSTEQVRALYSYNAALGGGNVPGWVKRRQVAFDAWLAGVEREAAAKALDRLARAEKGLADWIGADIDTRGRTRLAEVAAEYREGKRS